MRRVIPTAICCLILQTAAVGQNPENIEQRSADPPALSAVADDEDQRHEERWQQATQIRHPSIEEKFSVHQPIERCFPLKELKKNRIGYIDGYVFKVVDIIGPEEVVVGVDNEVPISIRDGSSDGLAKDQDVTVGGMIQVTGTIEYKRADGSSMTIPTVKLLTEDQMAQATKYHQQAVDKAFRTWRSNKGNHKIEAMFVKFENNKVHLKTREGKTIAIEPKDLSVPDRKYYRGLLKGDKPKK